MIHNVTFKNNKTKLLTAFHPTNIRVVNTTFVVLLYATYIVTLQLSTSCGVDNTMIMYASTGIENSFQRYFITF